MLLFNSTSWDDEEEEEEEEEVHTPSNPYCSDLDCWCHTDVQYHSEVTEFDTEDETANEGEYKEALSFFGIRLW